MTPRHDPDEAATAERCLEEARFARSVASNAGPNGKAQWLAHAERCERTAAWLNLLARQRQERVA
jgi:hypothetical protein